MVYTLGPQLVHVKPKSLNTLKSIKFSTLVSQVTATTCLLITTLTTTFTPNYATGYKETQTVQRTYGLWKTKIPLTIKS